MAGAGKRAGSAYVALLRAINVGGKNSLPMKELVAMFEAAGCADVTSYIQSGNVVFRASETRAARVPGLVATALAARLGCPIPVVVRAAAELHAVASANPFLRAGAEPKALHVMFLADRPAPAMIAALDPRRSPPDQFTVSGREIYLHCPDGIGRSKLTNDYFERRLATSGTARNWRTVLKLIEMTGAP